MIALLAGFYGFAWGSAVAFVLTCLAARVVYLHAERELLSRVERAQAERDEAFPNYFADAAFGDRSMATNELRDFLNALEAA